MDRARRAEWLVRFGYLLLVTLLGYGALVARHLVLGEAHEPAPDLLRVLRVTLPLGIVLLLLDRWSPRGWGWLMHWLRLSALCFVLLLAADVLFTTFSQGDPFPPAMRWAAIGALVQATWLVLLQALVRLAQPLFEALKP